MKLPCVFVHVPFGLQSCVCAVHSSTSEQVTPSPCQPLLHAQVNEPWVFVHVALVLQLLPEPWPVHSSRSLQVTPLPEKPDLQAQVKLPAVLVQVASALQLFERCARPRYGERSDECLVFVVEQEHAETQAWARMVPH